MTIELVAAATSPDLTQADPIALGVAPEPGDLWVIWKTAGGGDPAGFTLVAGPEGSPTFAMYARECEAGDTGSVTMLAGSHWITALFRGIDPTPAVIEELAAQSTPGGGGDMAVSIDVPAGPHLVLGYVNHDNTIAPEPLSGWTIVEDNVYATTKFQTAVYGIVEGGDTESPGASTGFGGTWFGFAAAFPGPVFRLCPTGFRTETSTDEIENRVSMARAGGTAIVKSDIESITRYGIKTHQRHDLITQRDADVGMLAAWRLSQHARRTRRIDDVGIDVDFKAPAATIEAILDVELGDAHAIEWHDGAGDPLELTTHVMGLSITITPRTWRLGVDLWDFAGGGTFDTWDAAIWDQSLWQGGPVIVTASDDATVVTATDDETVVIET